MADHGKCSQERKQVEVMRKAAINQENLFVVFG